MIGVGEITHYLGDAVALVCARDQETLEAAKKLVKVEYEVLPLSLIHIFTGVHHNSLPREKVLEYAALAECPSSHPISRSLQRAYGCLLYTSRCV